MTQDELLQRLEVIRAEYCPTPKGEYLEAAEKYNDPCGCAICALIADLMIAESTWDDPAKTADFFTGPPPTGKEHYEAFGEWAKEHGYNVDDDAQMEAVLESYGCEK